MPGDCRPTNGLKWVGCPIQTYTFIDSYLVSVYCYCYGTSTFTILCGRRGGINFRRAAERLRVAQPALSAQIKNLEGELGVRLFDRTTRSVLLTRTGQVFLTEAR